MTLSYSDHQRMLRGLSAAGFRCITRATTPTNPISLRLTGDPSKTTYKLWTFQITHGGGGAKVRAEDEYRIQITNGPTSLADWNGNDVHLLLGYSPSSDVIVAYDEQWLRTWTGRFVTHGKGGSPSVQVRTAEIEAGARNGIHHFTKTTQLFGIADIVTMTPAAFPAFLLNHYPILKGAMNASQAMSVIQGKTEETLFDYCIKQGFFFDEEMLARYVAAMIAKPFVILAGISGTGKSKLAELAAEYYSRTSTFEGGATQSTPEEGNEYVYEVPSEYIDKSRFALVPVRPDWVDNQALFGFLNPITNQYESTQVLDLVLRARVKEAQNPDGAERYFLLLDEMNLARVEHYFSDWLSCSESRRVDHHGEMAQQPIVLHRSIEPVAIRLGDQDCAVPEALPIPPSVVVTGTINVDETTYGISPKVLDRAMVIEFDDVNLNRLRDASPSSGQAGRFNIPSQLPSYSPATTEHYVELPDHIHASLIEINSILHNARLHFGYRAANEMAAFMRQYVSMMADVLPDEDKWHEALDFALLQKVLPRIQGNRAKVEELLRSLLIFFEGATSSSAEDENNAAAKERYRHCRARCSLMLDTVSKYGFVSFFQ